MTLDSTKPIDQEHVDMLPYYIRQGRAEINSVIAADIKTATNLSVAAGTDTLVVGEIDDLSLLAIETIILTGLGVSEIIEISGGFDGQIKIFIFQDSNISFLDGNKSPRSFHLNQLPSGRPFAAQQDDVLAVINVGGDGTIGGYWKELYRTLSVK